MATLVNTFTDARSQSTPDIADISAGGMVMVAIVAGSDAAYRA